MESWMFVVAGNIATFIATWSVLRYRVAAIEKKQDSHDLEDTEYHKEMDRKIDAGFKRLDTVAIDVTRLQGATSKHLDMEAAEARFVTQKELDLRLKTIEITGAHTDENVASLKQDVYEVKVKLDELLHIVAINLHRKD